ncbi:type IV fimbrial biogenesis protein PilY1 [Elysia marginata]|uniref:Type IV fimbrial biogenesis protein PilY1 n=1 Tax=Elysia marginata TaxID=1093978 RepID=A0AAV4F7P7_9GAST|nr:type IV fimbrial biogenesis protein PilY1 [Elysia marginata]
MDDKTFKSSDEYCVMALSRQQGSSLVEVMVSLLLGAIMLLGAVQILVNSKRDFLIRDAMSSVEEAGNYTFDLIGGDLRVAGYKGCVSQRDINFDNLISSSGSVFQPERGIQGWEASNTGYADTLTPATWADAECGAFNNTTISSRASENQDQDFAHFAGDGSGNIGDWRGYTPDMEASFYDATVNYTPWADMSDANFRQARNHPVSGEADYTVLTDLVDRFYVVAEDTAGFTGDRPRRYGQINYERVPNRHIDWWDDHTIFQLRADRVRSWTVTFEYRDGPLGPEVIQRIEQNVDITDSAEVAKRQQNYANWYQYYRNRMFSVVASATKIVDSFPSVRYALGYINQSNLIVDFPDTQFGNESHNETIIEELIKRSRGSGGTPLPAALHRAGQSYRRTGTGAPIISECQLNYTMLLTDGDWSGAESAISDLDADTRSGWLSDVALHHYENDLRIDLKDEVPLGDNNTNKKQHMSTIGIAFGQIGSLVDTDDDGWPNPPLQKTDNWGSNKFDDLWHASFNSGGAYFSARNYFSLLTQLNDVFQNIINVTSSVAQLAIGSTSLQTDRRIYQARFDSKDWAGDLVAIHIDGDGKVVKNPDGSMRTDWSAKSRLAALGSTGHTRRVIITRKRTAGGTTEAVDINGDFVTDYIYAGDLNGDLWKFDFNNRNSSNWKVAFGNSGRPRPLFSAGSSRPITSTPTIGRHPVDGYLVYFGTGRYFAEGDNARKGQHTQSVYAIWDKNDGSSVTSTVSDGDLLEQKITTEFEVEVNSKDVALRQTTANAIDWDTHKGWKMELILQQSGVTNFNNGERVIAQAALRNGNVIFLTQMPTGGLCESGGDSWIMEVDAYSGARLEENMFDINDDGEFDEEDSSYSSLGMTLNPSDPNYPTDNVVATGIKNEGIVQQPTIIPCQSSECKLMSGAGGSINTIHENDGQQTTGRQSWRQILLEE